MRSLEEERRKFFVRHLLVPKIVHFKPLGSLQNDVKQINGTVSPRKKLKIS